MVANGTPPEISQRFKSHKQRSNVAPFEAKSCQQDELKLKQIIMRGLRNSYVEIKKKEERFCDSVDILQK